METYINYLIEECFHLDSEKRLDEASISTPWVEVLFQKIIKTCLHITFTSLKNYFGPSEHCFHIYTIIHTAYKRLFFLTNITSNDANCGHFSETCEIAVQQAYKTFSKGIIRLFMLVIIQKQNIFFQYYVTTCQTLLLDIVINRIPCVFGCIYFHILFSAFWLAHM